MKIKLDKLVLDEAFYPRTAYDWVQAHRYAEAMQVAAKDKTAEKFPPIKVAPLGDGNFRVLDGWHRFKAALECRYESIDADVVDLSEKDQFIAAVKANLTHGKGLSNFDRAKIACRLRSSEFHWSLARVAGLLKLTQRSLSTMLFKRTGSTNGFGNLGKPSLVAKNLVTGTVAREGQCTPELNEVQRPFEGHSQRKIFEHVLGLMTNGAVDLDRPDVCSLLKEIASWLRAHSSEIKVGLSPKAA